MIKKRLLILSLTLLAAGIGFFAFRQTGPTPQKIIAQRDLAIQKAVEAGDYRCCINPPCTMCFLEANEWNNYTPGTCACDDLISQGKDPCPQCKNSLCNKNQDGTCQLNHD